MKRKRKKSKFSTLRKYKSSQWRKALSPFHSNFLKIKLACIIVWDFYDEEEKKCPVFLKKLCREYDMYEHDYFHIMYDEKNLYKALRQIGYPEKLSRKRSFFREEIND